MKVIETMRRKGNRKAQLIKSKINLRNCNFFFPKDIYRTTTRSNCEVSQKIPRIRSNKCIQNVPFIKLTEHSEVQIRLFEILLQNYERGD